MKPTIPLWLRIIARIDFVAAVILTVIVPLGLLLRSLGLLRRGELRQMIAYWRASAMLMVTVYALIGGRRSGYVAGVAARVIIPWVLRAAPVGADAIYDQWRKVTIGYCFLGVAATVPMLEATLTGEVNPVAAAYREPPLEFARLLHPNIPPERLGVVGDLGLVAYLVGALALAIWRRRQRLIDAQHSSKFSL